MTRVRYYGHIGSPTGYGQAGAEMCMAMLEAGLELDILPTGNRIEKMYEPLLESIKDESDAHPEPDAVIVHTLPLDCQKVVERADGFPVLATRIAYTTWESCSPALAAADALRHFNQVWVPSLAAFQQVSKGFAGRLPPRPIVDVVPHAYDPAAYPANGREQPRDPGEPYRFYYIGAWSARKNPEGVVRAYLRAFRREDNVQLIIHSVGAPASAVDIAVLAATGRSRAEEAPIVFSTEELVSEGIHALHWGGDCFVSASRGEAWNLPAFEAMLYRNRVIVTAEQGSVDFLRGTSAQAVLGHEMPAHGDVRLRYDPSGQCTAQYIGSHGLDVRSMWLDPDLRDLAGEMRDAYDAGNATRLQVSYDPATKFSRQVVGAQICSLIEGAKR